MSRTRLSVGERRQVIVERDVGPAAPPVAALVGPSRDSPPRRAAASPSASCSPARGKPCTSSRPAAPAPRSPASRTCIVMPTNQGVPVADNQNSLKAGLRGPALLEDFILREKITHFDHERIPERIVHARGSGAHGYFECYEPLTEYTRRIALSPRPASARRSSCASRPWPASAARPTPRATCAASPSSSTPTKATGTWSATTSRCSSSRTR